MAREAQRGITLTETNVVTLALVEFLERHEPALAEHHEHHAPLVLNESPVSARLDAIRDTPTPSPTRAPAPTRAR